MDMMITDYNWNDVPWQLVSTASDWHDGSGTAMYAFGSQKPANAERLLKEVRECISKYALESDRELPELKALEEFALAHVNKVKAIRKSSRRPCWNAPSRVPRSTRWTNGAVRPSVRRRR